MLLLLAIGALILLAACSTPNAAQFRMSSETGSAPHEISFTIDEAIKADTFDWDFGDGFGSEEKLSLRFWLPDLDLSISP